MERWPSFSAAEIGFTNKSYWVTEAKEGGGVMIHILISIEHTGIRSENSYINHHWAQWNQEE